MKVILSDKNGQPAKLVKAIAYCGGLAVTPSWWDGYDLGQYTITHVQSGAALYIGMDDLEAIRVMAAVCDRINVDWRESYEALCDKNWIKRRIRQIIREVVGE